MAAPPDLVALEIVSLPVALPAGWVRPHADVVLLGNSISPTSATTCELLLARPDRPTVKQQDVVALERGDVAVHCVPRSQEDPWDCAVEDKASSTLMTCDRSAASPVCAEATPAELQASDAIDEGWEDRGAAAAWQVLRRIMSSAAPSPALVPWPCFSGTRRRVRFDLDAVTLHEIPPYSEIYGVHPRTFVFDHRSRRVPAAPSGFVSLRSVLDGDEEEFDENASSSEEDFPRCCVQRRR